MIGWLRRILGGTPKGAEWSVSAGSENGQPLVLRTRHRTPEGMAIDRYPASVELVWRFDALAHGGMPGTETSAEMMACEDVLGTLETPDVGLLGLTIMGNGRREWIWYVADADAFIGRARALVAASGRGFPLQYRKPPDGDA